MLLTENVALPSSFLSADINLKIKLFGTNPDLIHVSALLSRQGFGLGDREREMVVLGRSDLNTASDLNILVRLIRIKRHFQTLLFYPI